MGVIAVGVDIVSIERFEEACRRTDGFVSRILTDAEIGSRTTRSLAARFAAKEAVAKALGAPGGLAWHDCEVVTETSGQPTLRLSGTVAAAAAERGITEWRLSLSHDGGMAIAFVVASGD